MARRLRRSCGQRRDPAPGQRGRRGALERRLRLSRPGATPREPHDRGRHPGRSRAPRRRPGGGRGHARRRAARPKSGVGRRRLRLARHPAAQRSRSGPGAARRRGSVRPRGRRLRLRGHAAAAARDGGVRAIPAALHGAGHGRRNQQRVRAGLARPEHLPRHRPCRRAGLRGERGRLRDEAGVTRRGAPDLTRPGGTARDRPRLPRRSARCGGAGGRHRDASPARRRGSDTPLRRSRDTPGPRHRRARTHDAPPPAASFTPPEPVRSVEWSTPPAAYWASRGSMSPTPRSCRRSHGPTPTSPRSRSPSGWRKGWCATSRAHPPEPARALAASPAASATTAPSSETTASAIAVRQPASVQPKRPVP